MPKRQASAYEHFGVEAAQDYLKGGVPLNEKVAEIAQREDLNPDEIRRTAEAANQTTYSSLWKVADRKTIEFERADADTVLRSLNPDPITSLSKMSFHKEKVLGEEVPRGERREMLLEKAAGLSEKRITREGQPEQRLEHLWHVAKIARDKVATEIEALRLKKVAAQEEVAHEVRQCLLENQDRGLTKVASEIVLAVAQERPELVKHAAYLTVVALKSIDPRIDIDPASFAKVASPVESHLIKGFLSTGDMPVAVINGNCRVFQALEVVKSCKDGIDREGENLERADDEVGYIGRRLKESRGAPVNAMSYG